MSEWEEQRELEVDGEPVTFRLISLPEGWGLAGRSGRHAWVLKDLAAPGGLAAYGDQQLSSLWRLRRDIEQQRHPELGNP